MKKLATVCLAAIAFGLSASALAQAAGPAGGAPPVASARGKHGDRKAMQKMNEELLAKLNLTDDQKTKIKAHQEEMKAKLLELKKGNKGAKGAGKSEDVKEKTKAIRKENQQFMKQILTKDQMRELVRLRREAMKDMKAPTP